MENVCLFLNLANDPTIERIITPRQVLSCQIEEAGVNNVTYKSNRKPYHAERPEDISQVKMFYPN